MCQGCAQDFSLVKTEGPKIKAESAERGGVLGRGSKPPPLKLGVWRGNSSLVRRVSSLKLSNAIYI